MDKKQFETLNVVSFILLLLFLVTGRRFLLYLGFALVGTSILVKPLARILAIGWLKLSRLIGTLNSRLVLTLFFYLVLTPLALVRRFLGSDVLRLRDRGRGSHWKTVGRTWGRDDLEKTW